MLHLIYKKTKGELHLENLSYSNGIIHEGVGLGNLHKSPLSVGEGVVQRLVAEKRPY